MTGSPRPCGSGSETRDPRQGLRDPVIEGGFPHSEIRGSKLVRSSPRLIAAYHVLHRLSAPRHPPDALKALDRSHHRCPFPSAEEFRSLGCPYDRRKSTDQRKTYACFATHPNRCECRNSACAVDT